MDDMISVRVPECACVLSIMGHKGACNVPGLVLLTYRNGIYFGFEPRLSQTNDMQN